MKCAELLAVLNEYVEGTVDPAICEEFEKHMAGCNPCQVVVDNIRKANPASCRLSSVSDSIPRSSSVGRRSIPGRCSP
jgi:hypothetical protein